MAGFARARPSGAGWKGTKMGLMTLAHRVMGRPFGVERRQYPRTRDPALQLVIEGHKYPTIDWSLGGFLIGGFHRDIAVRETVTGKVRSRGSIKGGEFTARVARKTEDGQIGFRFIEIASKTWASMSEIA